MKPETIGKILAPAAAVIAPVLADKLAEKFDEKLDEIVDRVLDRLLPKLPDLSKLDDLVEAAIRGAFNALPFPFKI
ncbi:hypothetical protein SEA_HURRICANE_96 [Mycobacterium phage Hurricane]|uniref:Uncharacterized protein n=4 Tax=Keshuvirus TaxID=2948781 RepID=G1D507_9CAUD|nr:hypothetical protein SEA_SHEDLOCKHOLMES_98 [Mycobacterium phage ShedlockHolmes]YP_009637436.1 hypothetical protein FGG30_gp098 [Mycobacterium phage Pixie]YP_009951766.1 hypothetical protein I5G83_gp96 [Mycobacterium phage Hurricane]AOT23833.1 hypothetical protein SEA_TBOND007_95 [Mycobacterium phage TBond007]AEK09907.1 hypothetical protein PBI_PIXIE_98 [Mycobacterium phage Pixie]AKF15275.1 hypothetical protein SEA_SHEDLOCKHOLMES_98 [Mycobacterium phage ShedlockHolmes]ASR84840.1 hypothetica